VGYVLGLAQLACAAFQISPVAHASFQNVDEASDFTFL